jgi:hypothetical protein
MSEKFRDSIWDRYGIIEKIVSPMKIPKMVKAKQLFNDNIILDISASVEKEFAKADIASRIKPGMSIAITIGSRGIANLANIAKEAVIQVKKLGAYPFIFPAMGSHGGATAEGQRQIIESYGVTEQFIKAPIKSSMETIIIGYTSDGRPVHIDKNASKADGIILLNRIKPHTAFRGQYESGLVKMMAIGMGKQHGAEMCHMHGFGEMAKNIFDFGSIVLQNAKILFGIAIIENAYGNTYKIEAIPKEDILVREPVLLEEAKSLMPRIMFPKFDILIIDQIGKDISGDGADPNISGTFATKYAFGGPKFERYVVLDLSSKSHGNAIGMGMADISTKRLFDKIDFDACYPNALTSTVLSGVKVPFIAKNDELAIKAAIFSCAKCNKENPRIVRIKNTSHIEEIMISEALIEEAQNNENIILMDQPKVLPFDNEGNLPIGLF